MERRARSRSPHGAKQEGLPLAKLLLQHGLLDEAAVNLLNKAPLQKACEVLLSLGPDVDDPSAFVTSKLTASSGGATGQHVAPRKVPPPAFKSYAASRAGWHPDWRPSQQGDNDNNEEIILVHYQNAMKELVWSTKDSAIQTLVVWGMLDEKSSDFLGKAPEAEVKRIISALGGPVEVRNPSAFVTRKCTDLLNTGLMHVNDDNAGQEEVFQIYHNGERKDLFWFSRDDALADLRSWGVLDEKSVDFLLKVPETEAKNIVAALNADVRNPSAFVTKKAQALLEVVGGKGAYIGGKVGTPSYVGVSGRPNFGGGGKGGGYKDGKVARASINQDSFQVYDDGKPVTIQWTTKQDVVTMLMARGILDQTSCDFLSKVSDPVAKDVLAQLADPTVRNPSAFVTRLVKERQKHQTSRRPAKPEPKDIVICHEGREMIVEWESTEDACMMLVGRGVLDEKSADYLQKISERDAMEIVASLGPEVRNPSAFVTKEAKKRM